MRGGGLAARIVAGLACAALAHAVMTRGGRVRGQTPGVLSPLEREGLAELLRASASNDKLLKDGEAPAAGAPQGAEAGGRPERRALQKAATPQGLALATSSFHPCDCAPALVASQLSRSHLMERDRAGAAQTSARLAIPRTRRLGQRRFASQSRSQGEDQLEG